MSLKIPKIEMQDIIERYETILFDAFGVLIDAEGALPFAKELIDHLNKVKKKYFILTNGSKFNISETSQSYQNRGLNIPETHVISSGSLIEDWLKNNKLVGAKCYVLGPDSSKKLVSESGGLVVDNQEEDFEVFIISNQDGFQYPEDVNHSLSMIFRKINNHEKIRLLLPNPDAIYPAKDDLFGVTSGALAAMYEAALHTRFPDQVFEFEKLGKPFSPIFEKAKEKAGKGTKILIGDQILTDILGARSAQIDSALIETGITNTKTFQFDSSNAPTYLLSNLKIKKP